MSYLCICEGEKPNKGQTFLPIMVLEYWPISCNQATIIIISLSPYRVKLKGYCKNYI